MGDPYEALIILEDNPTKEEAKAFFNDLDKYDLLYSDKTISQQINDFFDKGKFNYVIKCKHKGDDYRMLVWGDFVEEQKVLYFSVGVSHIGKPCIKSFAKSIRFFCKHFKINSGFLDTEIGIEDAKLLSLKKFAKRGMPLNKLFKFSEGFNNIYSLLNKRLLYSIIGPSINDKTIDEIKSKVISLIPSRFKKKEPKDIMVKKYGKCLMVESCPEYFDPWTGPNNKGLIKKRSVNNIKQVESKDEKKIIIRNKFLIKILKALGFGNKK